MTLKALFFKGFPKANGAKSPLFSKALMVEDFRRFWPLPVLATLAGFLTTIFPILISYSTLNENYYLLQSTLSGTNGFLAFENVVIPICVAVVLFKYMHSVSASTIVHAMPVTRAGLYASHVASGSIMSLAHIIFNGLILLMMHKPVLNPVYENGSNTPTMKDIFTPLSVLDWMWQAALIVLVIYAIACFAASVSGNQLFHFLLSCTLVFLTSGILLTLTFYFDSFLVGYVASSDFNNIMISISPVLRPFSNDTGFDIGWTLWYAFSAIVLLGMGYYVYQTKKLERVSDSMTLRPMALFISFIITFLGMTAFGAFFTALAPQTSYRSTLHSPFVYIGFAIGGLLTFIIMELVLAKSWSIFNKNMFIRLGIYALCSTLFIVGINIDITGYERKLPDAGKVKSMYIDEDILGSLLSPNNGNYKQNSNRIEFSDPENIQAAIDLHASLIDIRNEAYPTESALFNCYFDYAMKNGTSLERGYFSIPNEKLFINPDYQKIIGSTEFKQKMNISNLMYTSEALTMDPYAFQKLTVTSSVAAGEPIVLSETEQIELYSLLKADIMDQSFEGIFMPKGSLISMSFASTAQSVGHFKEISDGRVSSSPQDFTAYQSEFMNFKIGDSYTRVIDWLKSKGYYDRLMLNIDDVAYAVLDENSYNSLTYDKYDKEMTSVEEINNFGLTPPTPSSTRKVITDKAEIMALISNSTPSRANSYSYDSVASHKLYICVRYSEAFLKAHNGEYSNFYIIDRCLIDLNK